MKPKRDDEFQLMRKDYIDWIPLKYHEKEMEKVKRKVGKLEWKETKKELPETDDWRNLYRVMMCTVYIHDPTDPDVEHYYDVGHFCDGVFISDLDHREVKPHYWAFFNEPGIDYSELSHEELRAQLKEDMKELEKDIEAWRREHGLGDLEC